MDHPITLSCLHIGHLLCAQAILSVHRPRYLFMDHPIYAWTIPSIHGPSSLQLSSDHPSPQGPSYLWTSSLPRPRCSGISISIHAWRVLSAQEPYSQFIDHLRYTWTIHLCMDHILSIHTTIFSVLAPFLFMNNLYTLIMGGCNCKGYKNVLSIQLQCKDKYKDFVWASKCIVQMERNVLCWFWLACSI